MGVKNFHHVLCIMICLYSRLVIYASFSVAVGPKSLQLASKHGYRTNSKAVTSKTP